MCLTQQTKSNNLNISQPNDPAEIEADQIADRVMRMPVDDAKSNPNHFDSETKIHRKYDACEEEDEEKVETIHRKDAFAGAAPVPQSDDAPPSIRNVLDSGGRPLDLQARSFFEPRFRTDLSHVRIFDGDSAGQSARSINARAYTFGNNIVFGNGEYKPESQSGKHLIAHELAHAARPDMRPVIHRQAIAENLKLPCTWGDYTLEDNRVGGIRILVAMATADRKSLAPLKDIAAQIGQDNKAISDPKFQVKTCIIAYTTTRFALFKGEPVLMIDPAPEYANVETISHEMGHAVYHFLSHNKTAKINKTIKADDWITNLADIFLQLKSITLDAGKPSEFKANWLVDPSILTPGGKKEHPTDVDEFHSSAKEAYQHHKKELKDVFAKYGKQDKSLPELGKRLLALLDFLYGGTKLTLPKKMGTAAADIESELKGIGEPSKVEDTLGSGLNTILRKLLDPDDRRGCK